MFETLAQVWDGLCKELGLKSEGPFRASGENALILLASWLDGYYDFDEDAIDITIRNGIVEFKVVNDVL